MSGCQTTFNQGYFVACKKQSSKPKIAKDLIIIKERDATVRRKSLGFYGREFSWEIQCAVKPLFVINNDGLMANDLHTGRLISVYCLLFLFQVEFKPFETTRIFPHMKDRWLKD